MGMKFEYAGTTYDVPCMPKKEWGEWMTNGAGCHVPHEGGAILCGNKFCPLPEDCIYRRDNWEARKAFYYECFPEEKPEEKPAEKPSCDGCANYKPKEEPEKLPKLTQEVFERPDCPEWAKWAAVDKDGTAWWYEHSPELNSNQWVTNSEFLYSPSSCISSRSFDASDWENSLIEKSKKFRYKILEVEDRNKLESLVGDFLEHGWKLKGGATKYRKSYTQTLIKEV